MALFNVRVYGLLVNDNIEVLVSDENIRGSYITKFPGGGLEFGEGTIDGLKREFMEELNTGIDIVSHFYTTDFFQISAFNNKDQIISIYYLVRNTTPINKPIKTKSFDFDVDEDQATSVRWMSIEDMNMADVTLEIDKVVVNMLKNSYI
jgi:8-oxo-dGTP diphosphatase